MNIHEAATAMHTGNKDLPCYLNGRCCLHLSGGLSEVGALLCLLLLLLVLHLLGHTDVILHELVLLDVGSIVLLDYKGTIEKRKISYCSLCSNEGPCLIDILVM